MSDAFDHEHRAAYPITQAVPLEGSLRVGPFSAAHRASIDQADELFAGMMDNLQKVLEPLKAQEIRSAYRSTVLDDQLKRRRVYEGWMGAESKARKAAQVALIARQDSQKANNVRDGSAAIYRTDRQEKMVATLNKIDKARKEKTQLIKEAEEMILAKGELWPREPAADRSCRVRGRQ